MANNPYFPTHEEILDQLLSFLPPAWRANLAGKVIKRLLVAFSLSLEAVYALLARLLRLSIVITSEGGWLQALVAGMGMSTYGGTTASVSVRFRRYATDTAVSIPMGVEVGAIYGQIFKTSIAAVIPVGELFVDVPCMAVEPGIAGNVGIGEIISLVTGISGVDEVSNPNPATGGRDPERDEEIKARLPRHLESLHRATIPATEYAIALDRERFPEVQAFLTQRNYGTPGYFRGVLSDFSGGDIYRPSSWVSLGNGVYYTPTALTEVNGLCVAGFPCRRFGIVERSSSGEEYWRASSFVTEVEAGDWRFCHDVKLGRIYARADGRDLNTMNITIVAGVVWRALRTLEENWAANGVYCDVIVPFVVRGAIALSYTLEPGYIQSDVELALRSTLSDFVRGLAAGQALEIEAIYAALNTVRGAAGILVLAPSENINIPADSVFRLSALPSLTRVAA